VEEKIGNPLAHKNAKPNIGHYLVQSLDAKGKLIGKILLPETPANLCFGGVKRNRLFMAASHSVYSLFVNTQGAPGG